MFCTIILFGIELFSSPAFISSSSFMECTVHHNFGLYKIPSLRTQKNVFFLERSGEIWHVYSIHSLYTICMSGSYRNSLGATRNLYNIRTISQHLTRNATIHGRFQSAKSNLSWIGVWWNRKMHQIWCDNAPSSSEQFTVNCKIFTHLIENGCCIWEKLHWFASQNLSAWSP